MQSGQSRSASLIEAVINIAVGLVISYTANIIVLRALGLPITHSQVLFLAAILTVISIARSYLLRRFFNWLHLKGYLL